MTIEVGAVAPAFTLKDQNRQDVSLADFAGRKSVLLVFYPYAFSRVCQGELTLLQAELPRFQNDEVQLLTVSVDSPFAHRAWAEQQGFTFPLLADFWPHGAVARAYGVFDEVRGMALRGTFVVDRSGIVRHASVNDEPEPRDITEYADLLAAR